MFDNGSLPIPPTHPRVLVTAPQGTVVSVSRFHLVFIVHPVSVIHYK